MDLQATIAPRSFPREKDAWYLYRPQLLPTSSEPQEWEREKGKNRL